MNIRVFSKTVGLFAAIAISACAPHNPAKPVDPVTLIGGQPGKISVYGVLATHPKEELIVNEPKTGKSKFGQAPATKDANKATVDKNLPTQMPPAPSEAALKKAYAFGCSDDQVKTYLKRDKSDTMDANELKAFNDSQKAITAGTVVLCGKDPLKANAQLTISAQNLILVGLDLTFTGAAGMSFQAENLQVVGANKLTSVAPDSNDTSLDGGPLTLIVSKTADLNGATLTLSAQGSNYQAK